MPILSSTQFYGTITYLGVVPDRAISLRAEARDQLILGYDGVAGDTHSGLTRPSCSRVTTQYARGTEIRNTRQLSILSAEDLAAIARELDLPHLPPTYLGANIVLHGIPDLTQLPPASRLIAENGTSITIDMENGPCRFPAQEIETDHPGKGAGFINAARGRRGVTAWVERPGTLKLGLRLRLHVPPLRSYAPLA
jgi:hypothetical protein